MAIVKLEFNKFPSKYTLEGGNISPKIEIDSPIYSLSYVLLMGDQDSLVIHWLIYIIPNREQIEKDTLIIPEGVIHAKMAKDIFNYMVPYYSIDINPGINSFGKIGYTGPCPPVGETHKYIFKVYGILNILLLPFGFALNQLEDVMQKEEKAIVTDFGQAFATYE